MKEIELRVSYLLAALVFAACGSSAPTDFNSPDPGGMGSGGNAGAQQGGNSGAGLGGNAGAPLGGSGGSVSGGSGGTGAAGAGAGGGLGGSAGSQQAGAAGSGLGGTIAGGGAIAGGGNSSGGTGPRGGTGGSGTVPYACGTLMCIQTRQMCVHTMPAMSSGTHMYQCLEYPDSCATVDCSCFCKGPQNSPCGSGSACTCSGDAGRVTVQCGGS